MIESLLLFTFLPADTVDLPSQTIDEVVIVSASSSSDNKRSVKGQAATIDEHLGEFSHVNLIRRGSYAWEPTVNNMQTERLSVTIDGMKIFYACTDKMDPVTSYVESSNLQSISLNSGLNGNPQATGNIGGSLDLKLRKAGFMQEPGTTLHSGASAGHEWNGHLQMYGADAAVSTHSLYANGGAYFRHADNYKAGGGEELLFSQFRKVNVFANVGARLAEDDVVEGTVIFDRASNVGYPALNMDVAKAEGIISSASYTHLFHHPTLQSWETKLYYNHITHEMDDTHRPDVQIHMDMPGRSQTGGLYSLLTAANDRHDARLNYDLYYNRLFADMTMYASGASPMYMVTWPDVGTLCTGLAATDDVRLASGHRLRLSAKIAWQTQRLNDKEGYHALSVFFPGMENSYHQTTGRIAASYRLGISQWWDYSVGTGWGSRAPTVTEAYGYYLNNTFDQYDYIGNPRLKNESAFELNASTNVHLKTILVKAEANAFFFSNYIIGLFETRLSPMTIGAEGVKVYSNTGHATIINTSLTAEWTPCDWLRLKGGGSYAMGRDNDNDALPLVAPLAWHATAEVGLQPLSCQLTVKGNARQRDYGEKYGETATRAWTVVGISMQYALNKYLTLRAGGENLLDRHYATYADWNNIPQKGRNIYASLALYY